ncbi:DNA (cytosine-5)-methyltransferase 3-like [Alexandromys fortis]|uniref:DNA (cytosine-5)-methyltransferase 3-like n=1 Tax=Alexandromys fortis TaxID=100897 RepID=UPI00215338BD|nr:DNA (cytosine-5)-methyltransferase 3-like [Microtus fortis]
MGSRKNSCSKTGETWDLETLDSSSPDSANHLEEQWLKSTRSLSEDEHSVEVVLEDSLELLSLTSPPPGREIIRYEVTVNQRNIEDICLCCGSLQVYTQHPLFEGGMCAPCKDIFLETIFLYDMDGHQSYCSICCFGKTLFICESPDCTRCYCFECVDILVGPGTSERISAMACWVCFLCLPFTRSGLLQRRRKWRHQLKAFHDLEGSNPVKMYKIVSAWKRQPVRVLNLFGKIDKELESLGFLESGSGSEEGRLKYLEDVTNVVRRDVEAVTLQDVRSRVLQNAVRVWSNIPGLKSKHSALTPKELQSLETQTRTRGKMADQKVDLLVKTCLLPLREYFKYFSQNPLPLYK